MFVFTICAWVVSFINKHTTDPRTHTRKTHFQNPGVQTIGKLVKQHSARSENILFFLQKTICFHNLLFLNIVVKCSSTKEGESFHRVLEICRWWLWAQQISKSKSSSLLLSLFLQLKMEVFLWTDNRCDQFVFQLTPKMPWLVSNLSFFALIYLDFCPLKSINK